MLFPPLDRKEIRLMFGAAILANVLFFGLAGCLYFGKPYALQNSEHLALRIQSDGNATNVLRAWFAEIQLRPDSTGKEPGYLQIPPSLSSEWWQGAKAWVNGSQDGKFEGITITRDFDGFVTIGPPTASAADLGLAGQPPRFPVQIAEGMYAWVRYK